MKNLTEKIISKVTIENIIYAFWNYSCENNLLENQSLLWRYHKSTDVVEFDFCELPYIDNAMWDGWRMCCNNSKLIDLLGHNTCLYLDVEVKSIKIFQWIKKYKTQFN